MDKSKKLIRPVQKLIPLEVAATESVKKERLLMNLKLKLLDENVPETIKVNK